MTRSVPPWRGERFDASPLSRMASIPYRFLPAAVTVAALVAAARPAALGAQRVDSLPSGARVRIVLRPASRGVVDATYLRADSAGLAVTPGRGAAATYAWQDVRRVERHAERLTAGEAFGRGAQRGARVGAYLSAAALAVAAYSDLRRPCHCQLTTTAAVGAVGVFYTGLFAVTGGALGLGHRDRWVPVRLRP